LIRDILREKLEKNFKGVNDLMNLIIKLQQVLMTSKPLEFSIANTIKRVTSIIREQAKLQDFTIDEEKVELENQESKIGLCE